MKKTFSLLFFAICLQMNAQQRVSEIKNYRYEHSTQKESLEGRSTLSYEGDKLKKITTKNQDGSIDYSFTLDFKYSDNHIEATNPENKIRFEMDLENNKPILIKQYYYSVNLELSYDENGKIATLKNIKYHGAKKPQISKWFYNYEGGKIIEAFHADATKKKNLKLKDVKNPAYIYTYDGDKLKNIAQTVESFKFEYTDNKKIIYYQRGQRKIEYTYENGNLVEVISYSQNDEDYRRISRAVFTYENGNGNEELYLDYQNDNIFTYTLLPEHRSR
ncbi:hypothetical protein SAMN04488007_3511 [Maribacter aquivivus]|uniref:Uncharacterized protein n=1 Tax=Maribacter aquivivus TaxID=228958 RepID=A0A1M6U6T1_9FLAO|nr:hypothetical protein [Maribacter aquivivus]SHK64884.1 hypothetical protein SAMN04488007_3511 [Maribacter aquivivus]